MWDVIRGGFSWRWRRSIPRRTLSVSSDSASGSERPKRRFPGLGSNNAAVVHGEGLEAISRLPDACADHVHVLFPDPWPKRRHQARRMVRKEFFREVSRILKRRGILRLLTDDENYARAMESCAAGFEAFQRALDDGREYPPTEFQIKFLADSRPVYALFLQRVS